MAETYENYMAGLEAAATKQIEDNKGEEGTVTTGEEGQEQTPAVVVEETPAAEEIVVEGLQKPTEETPEGEPQVAELGNPDDTTSEETPSNDELQEGEGLVDWDGIPSKEAETPASFDFKSLAIEAGIEAESKETFISKIGELKVKADTPDPNKSLPDNLQRAIEIASQDGDYMEFLQVNTVDWNAYDNLDIVQQDYARLLTDGNGALDTERLTTIMDSMSDADIDRRGLELKSQLVQRQEQISAGLLDEATRKRDTANIQLKGVLDKLDVHNGFKYSPTHKKQMYDGITSGNMIAEMFHDSNGDLDQAKVVDVYSKFLYGDKQTKFLQQQIGAKAKKEMLNKISNKQITPPVGTPPSPSSKPATMQEQMAKDVADGLNPFRIANK